MIAAAGSAISPGNSPGVLTIAGNVVFAAGSTYVAEVQGAAADRIAASGTATIDAGATLRIVPLGGAYTFSTPYVLLSATGGVTGSFGTVTGLDGFGAGIAAAVSNTPGAILLTLTALQLTPVVAGGLLPGTQNQTNVARRLDGAVAAGFNPAPFFALYNLPAGQMAGALNQLSGEGHAAAQRVALDDERLLREAVLNRMRGVTAASARSQPRCAAAGLDPERVGVWGQGFGSFGRFGSDGNGSRITRSTGGFVIGADAGTAFTGGGWRLGGFGHFQQALVKANGVNSTSDVAKGGGGLYGSFSLGGFTARLGGSLGHVEARTSRRIAFAGFGEHASGRRDGLAAQLFGELGYRLAVTQALTLEPYLNLAHASVRLGGTRELGGVAALNVSSSTMAQTLFGYGLRAESAVDLGGRPLTLSLALGARTLVGGDARARVDTAFASTPAFAAPVFAAKSRPHRAHRRGRRAHEPERQPHRRGQLLRPDGRAHLRPRRQGRAVVEVLTAGRGAIGPQRRQVCFRRVTVPVIRSLGVSARPASFLAT